MPRQHVTHGDNRHAIELHAFIGVVLGCLSCDHANTRTIGTSVPNSAYPVRRCFTKCVSSRRWSVLYTWRLSTLSGESVEGGLKVKLSIR